MVFRRGKGGKNSSSTIVLAIASSRSKRHHQVAVLRELWGFGEMPAWSRNACSSSSCSFFPDFIATNGRVQHSFRSLSGRGQYGQNGGNAHSYLAGWAAKALR